MTTLEQQLEQRATWDTRTRLALTEVRRIRDREQRAYALHYVAGALVGIVGPDISCYAVDCATARRLRRRMDTAIHLVQPATRYADGAR